MTLTEAIHKQWPNMPSRDIDKCIDIVNEVAAKYSTTISAWVHRNSYLAIEGEGLDFRLAYIHLGHIRVRDDSLSIKRDRYAEVGLTNYNKKPHKHRLVQIKKQLCPECFLELPTSGAECVCQSDL